jgi:hypothetical protein
MIPLGSIGRASADYIANPQRLRPSGSGQDDARGVISFLAIPLVVFWIMTEAWRHALGSAACWAVFLTALTVLWCVAFRTRGRIGWLCGLGFSFLAAYCLWTGMLANSGLFLKVLSGGIAFVFVGCDQVAVKEERASKVQKQR